MVKYLRNSTEYLSDVSVIDSFLKKRKYANRRMLIDNEIISLF